MARIPDRHGRAKPCSCAPYPEVIRSSTFCCTQLTMSTALVTRPRHRCAVLQVLGLYAVGHREREALRRLLRPQRTVAIVIWLPSCVRLSARVVYVCMRREGSGRWCPVFDAVLLSPIPQWTVVPAQAPLFLGPAGEAEAEAHCLHFHFAIINNTSGKHRTSGMRHSWAKLFRFRLLLLPHPHMQNTPC
eukprot:scaffold84428_cov27-Tisochrysis_lutea.AAC.2